MEYETSLSRAQLLIGGRDPFEVDILALTLETEVLLWSNDSDFERIDKITVLKTKNVMELVRFFKGDK